MVICFFTVFSGRECTARTPSGGADGQKGTLLSRDGSFRSGLPTAAQRFVEPYQSKVLVSHGVAQSDLGVEIAPLGIQYVDIVDTAGTVLQVGQPNILAGCVAQSAFQGGRFADMSVGGNRVGRLAEDLEHFLFVLQTRLVVSCTTASSLSMAISWK